MTDQSAAADRVAGVVAAAVEQVFDTVAGLHGAALDALGAGTGAGGAGLEACVRGLLSRPDRLAAGLGLVAAPRPDRDLRLLWWQLDPAGERLLALKPDLRPASLGFYAYPTPEWFDVPRRTGRRHVVGPYVDVHGTGRYLLTLTAPVVVSGEFLGVVGADVPVSRFESHLLSALGTEGTTIVVLNQEGRVVLSTTPRMLVGALVRTPPDLAMSRVTVPNVPWEVYLPGR